jgi:hypothetical protein
VAKKTGPKPTPEGPRDGLIAVKCRKAYKEWVEEFAEQERVITPNLIDQALVAYAELKGFRLPPKR